MEDGRGWWEEEREGWEEKVEGSGGWRGRWVKKVKDGRGRLKEVENGVEGSEAESEEWEGRVEGSEGWNRKVEGSGGRK